MQLFLSQFAKRLSKSLAFFLLIFLLESFISIDIIRNIDTEFSVLFKVNGWAVLFFKGFIASLVSATTIWVICSISKYDKINTFLKIVFIIFYTILFFSEKFIIATYGVGFNATTIGAMLASNPKEASEFMDSIFSINSIIYSIFIYLGVLGICFFINIINNKIKFNRLSYFANLSILFIGFVLTFAYHWRGIYIRFKDGIVLYENSSSWERLAIGSYLYMDDISSDDISKPFREKGIEGLSLSKNFDNLNIVLVIGESLSRGYLSTYGYPLKNTPKIDSLIQNGEIILFSDVVSPAPNTLESLREVLTLHNYESKDPWYTYPPLPLLFSMSEYWVQWSSNQEKSGKNNAIMQIASTSDSTYFINSIAGAYMMNPKKKSYDGDLLEHLINTNDEKWSEIKHKSNKKNLFQVVHLMGSHTKYAARFPKEFAKFIRGGEFLNHLNNRELQIILDYINSVYYNDYIISSIIEKYKNENTILVYFSDHGQVMFDNPQDPTKFGHGLTKEAISVPFMIYASEKFRTENPDIYQNIIKAKDRRIMLDIFAMSFANLMGIKSKWYQEEFDMFSDNYNNDRVRKVKGLGKELQL